MRAKTTAVVVFLAVSCVIIVTTLAQKMSQGSDRHPEPGPGVDARIEQPEAMADHVPEPRKRSEQGTAGDTPEKSRLSRGPGESVAVHQTRLGAQQARLKRSGSTPLRATSSASHQSLR